MSRLLIVPVALVAGLLLWLWLGDGFGQLAQWAASEQREFQNRIAGVLRGLRAGHDGAFWLLMGLCFAYGFFHAVGPGHGKILIGGYGVGRRVPWLRLSTIGLLSSLGQAVTAVALVYSGVLVFDMTRENLIGVTEDVMAPVSFGAIALVGLWLIWRGLRRLLRRRGHAGHDHSGGVCESCGHKHGPDLDEIEQATTWREALALVVSIAMRPCTGALFVLLITWQMGIGMAGVAGAFAMALGTATVTISVGLGAVGMRGGIFGSAKAYEQAALVMPVVEVLAGFAVALVAGGLMLRTI